MKQNWKKWTALVLAVTLIFTMVGCGNQEKENAETAKTTDNSVAESSESTPTTAATEEAGPFTKYTDPVTLTRAQMTCSATQWKDGDSETNNPWTRAALEDYNIVLEDSWSADGSQYADKINLSIASKTLPDVFWANCNQFKQITELGLAADMTAVYEQYASDSVKTIMDSDKECFESGIVDGKLQGISTQSFGAISQMNCVWIRNDWMENLGLTAPKTMDELYAICKAFTENDPDGNGKNDTYGLAVDKTLSNLYTLMAAYHANPTIWLNKEDGSIAYGAVQSEVKTALGAFQNMYSEGIINKEFAIADSTKMSEDLISGKVGVAIWGSSFGYAPGIDVIKNNGEKAIFKPYAIPSSDGETVKLSRSWPVGNYIVVSKDCKNPEAAMKMVNLYCKIANESTAEDYDQYMNNELSWGAIPFQVQNPMGDYNQYVEISKVQDSRDTSNLRPDQLSKYNHVIDWIDSKNPDSVGQFSQVSKEGAYGIMKDLVDSESYITTAYRGVSTDTMVAKQSSLDTMQAEVFTKIIMGESIDTFDKFVDQWNSLGGSDITKEMNELYGK